MAGWSATCETYIRAPKTKGLKPRLVDVTAWRQAERPEGAEEPIPAGGCEVASEEQGWRTPKILPHMVTVFKLLSLFIAALFKSRDGDSNALGGRTRYAASLAGGRLRGRVEVFLVLGDSLWMSVQ